MTKVVKLNATAEIFRMMTDEANKPTRATKTIRQVRTRTTFSKSFEIFSNCCHFISQIIYYDVTQRGQRTMKNTFTFTIHVVNLDCQNIILFTKFRNSYQFHTLNVCSTTQNWSIVIEIYLSR